MKKNKYYVYVIECADKSLYTGIAIDVARRVAEHNTSAKGAKYTFARRPVKLRYSKEYKNRSLASREEFRVKKLSREEKLCLIGINSL
jgi:putative endonuclease